MVPVHRLRPVGHQGLRPPGVDRSTVERLRGRSGTTPLGALRLTAPAVTSPQRQRVRAALVRERELEPPARTLASDSAASSANQVRTPRVRADGTPARL